MKIKVLGSSIDVGNGGHFVASYVIDGHVAIDAGSIGLIGAVEEQRAIKHIFLSHPHVDHIAALPILLDNVYEIGPDCPTIYCSEFTRDALLQNIFNERLWPDLVRLSNEESPFFSFQLLKHRTVTEIGDLTVTTIDLDHVVPTFGFLVENEESAIAIVSDTSPTEEIWSVARAHSKLKAVFLESAFPNSMVSLAERTGHLTPLMFMQEYRKLDRDIPVVAIHIKAAYSKQVIRELESLGLAQLKISEPNAIYEF